MKYLPYIVFYADHPVEGRALLVGKFEIGCLPYNHYHHKQWMFIFLCYRMLNQRMLHFPPPFIFSFISLLFFHFKKSFHPFLLLLLKLRNAYIEKQNLFLLASQFVLYRLVNLSDLISTLVKVKKKSARWYWCVWSLEVKLVF